ncbi:MAG: MerC domain-containing protein [Planctomycetota bacterium]
MSRLESIAPESIENEASDHGTANPWADRAGLVASVACAIHCAAMPLVIGYLPMLGLSWLADESFHKVMALVCFGLAALAFLPGWRRHGSLAPVLVGSTGVVLLAVAAFGLECDGCATCSETSLAAAEEPVCSATDCAHCAEAEPETVGEAAAVGSIAWFTPLVTPLGGVLLVAGHLTNHRKSCACCGKGCPHDSEASAES